MRRAGTIDHLKPVAFSLISEELYTVNTVRSNNLYGFFDNGDDNDDKDLILNLIEVRNVRHLLFTAETQCDFLSACKHW